MVYQVFLKALPKNHARHELYLMSLTVDVPVTSVPDKIKSVINTYIVDSLREKLRTLVHKLRKYN